MSDSKFVHIHCSSEYSIKSSLIRIPKLIDKVKELGMTSIAITDFNNLFATIKFYKYAINAGIKPIFGSELIIKDENADESYSLLLLCKNKQGYLNLSELISLSYLKVQNIAGTSITTKQLIAYKDGLIMVASPIDSDIYKALIANKITKAKDKAKFWQSVFGDCFYIAVHRTERSNDEKCLRNCINIGVNLNIPLVATNNVQFLKKSDYQAHEIKTCIAESLLLDDVNRKKKYSAEQYLKSPEQMAIIFADLPELLVNSVEIAKRCNVHFELNKKIHLPDFPISQGLSVVKFIEQESMRGLEKRIAGLNVDNKAYYKRLQFELDVIKQMEFSGYFLIVADFIKWSRERDIPVGPGRGSGAGSLVAYALNITNVDPIEHELLFERFLNPERISMPDFDIDFCAERRDEVIEYVSKKYGSEKVSQIITYGKMAAKGVVRDVGRVLGHPYGFSDEISKLIPNKLNITLDEALYSEKRNSAELELRYNSEESVTTLIDISKELEGLIRNVGTHAGGVVIAPSKISDFCPVYKGEGKNDCVVSQFDKDDIEAIGLVKFDFLGLSNLTVIHKALKTIEAKKLSTKKINIDKLPLDDRLVYELLQNCDTVGVFQLESDGMRSYLKKLQVDCFEDIVAMLALYRPGPLESGMVNDYINVRHGTKIKYPHPMLEKILKPTNGVILYQEQVMKSAQLLAGYSLGEADILRRVIGKKQVTKMQRQRSVFVKGAKKNKISEDKANKIFDLIEKFGEYGFNKSHSVAYAYISYQTAWLKVHYKAAFMAAVLSAIMDDTDRVASTVSEIRNMGIVVSGPNVCQSNHDFGIKNDKTIIYGLGAIKGVGRMLADVIAKQRQSYGDYKSLFDFCLFIDKKFINKRAIEALIYSGAFDVFNVDRASLVKTYPNAIKQAEQRQNDSFSGQSNLFGNTQTNSGYERNYLSAISFSFRKKLQLEKSIMGYYFYNHPIDEYKNYLKDVVTLPQNIIFKNNKSVTIMALISQVNYKDTKSGKQIANVIVEDGKRQLNAVVFSGELAKVSNKLFVNEVVVIKGRMGKDAKGEQQLVVDDIKAIDDFMPYHAKSVEILLTHKHQAIFNELANVLKKYKGVCQVKICYQHNNIKGYMSLGDDYLVKPDKQFNVAVGDLLGHKAKVYY